MAMRAVRIGESLPERTLRSRRGYTWFSMFDTHCHLTFDCYESRISQVLADAKKAGVRGCITVATTTGDAPRVTALADQHADVWCSSGVHPLYSDQPIDWDAMLTAGRHPRCVAWGELGLDNHYEQPPADQQREVLKIQLDRIREWTAEGLAKPIIVHCREAYDDLIPILVASGLPSERFVFHCFTGTPEEADLVLEFGAWISFTGIVTFKNASQVAEASDRVPLDRLMVETDSPFLTPEPHRTTRPNEPRYVPFVADFLAHRRGIDPKEMHEILDANAERFFGIELPT